MCLPKCCRILFFVDDSFGEARPLQRTHPTEKRYIWGPSPGLVTSADSQSTFCER